MDEASLLIAINPHFDPAIECLPFAGIVTIRQT